MENTPAVDIFETTRLLKAWSEGDETALERLVPLVDAEMRRLARHYLRQERPGHILQTTALVNEAWAPLINCPDVSWPQPRASHRPGRAIDAPRPRRLSAAEAGAETHCRDACLSEIPGSGRRYRAADGQFDAGVFRRPGRARGRSGAGRES